MAISITIGGVDRTTNVEYDSFNLQRALTSQVDTLSFDVMRKGGASSGGYKPALLEEVLVVDGAQTIFGGQIIQIDEKVVGGSDVEQFSVSCKDFSFDMDRYLVVQTYEGMAIEDIIQDIVDNFLPDGYTTTDVSCAIVADSVTFNYEYPSKVFQQLAELVNYDWYVDASKGIHFFAKSTTPAPFDLTDTSGNYYYNTLALKDSLTNIRNSVIVRGGEYLGPGFTETVIADGEATIYKQGYRYNTISVDVDGVSQNVGIDNLNDPTLYDCLYNFQEKFVRFPEATKPAIGVTVAVGGFPYLPVLVRVINAASILEFGEFEFKIVDKTIKTKLAARERATAEIAAWGGEVNEGSFSTMTAGLEVGQQINISSVIRGMDTDFVISRIATSMVNGTEFIHTVTLITTRTFGMVEFLIGLLTKSDKEIVIQANEVFGVVRNLADEMITGDSIAAPTTSSPPYEWGTMVWGFGTWS